MQIERCESPESFLSATVEHRGRDPIRTNVIGSVATAAATGGRYTSECFWWVVRDDTDEVVGVAMRTAPWVLSLGPMPPAAVRALVPHVVAADPGLPGVAGFVEPVAVFLEAYEASNGPRPIASTQHQLLYEIERVSIPGVLGTPVVATFEQVGPVADWFAAFVHEVEGASAARTEDDRKALEGTVREGRVWLWSLHDVVVSMAGHAVPVDTPSGVVTRVGPVYTPPEHRRRGYGGAVTGALSEVLLERGSRVMLYTDAANPTSNKIYVALGYELVDEFVRHSFTGRTGHH